MSHDPIVDEVRAIREQLAAMFDFDIQKIVRDARQRQSTSQARIVSFQQPLPPAQHSVDRSENRPGNVLTNLSAVPSKHSEG